MSSSAHANSPRDNRHRATTLDRPRPTAAPPARSLLEPICTPAAAEAGSGPGRIQRCEDVEARTPAVVTPPHLPTARSREPGFVCNAKSVISNRADRAAATCRNSVPVRLINSIAESKHAIVHGTRVRADYGNLHLNVQD